MIRRLRHQSATTGASLFTHDTMEEERQSGLPTPEDLFAQQLGYENDAEFQRMIDNASRHVEQLEQMEQEELTQQTQTPAQPQEAVPLERSRRGSVERLEINDEEQVEVVKKAIKKKPVSKKQSLSEKFVNTIWEIALAYAGEDNVCIENVQFGSLPNRRKVLMIKWPFIEIVNRSNRRHQIKDMLVGLPFNDRDTGFDSAIHGGRLTISHVESYCGYRHSHLYTNARGMNPFCTGSDGINDLWSSLIIDGVQKEDFAIRFEGFLHQMYSFLSYESLEGVPYFRMSGIGYGSRSRYSSGNQYRDVRSIANALQAVDVDLSFDFNTAKVEVVHTDHIHSIMAEAVRTHQYRMPDGRFVDDPNADNSGRPTSYPGGYTGDDDKVPWKGQLRNIYIEPIHSDGKEQEEQFAGAKRYAHEQAVRQVFDQIEREGRERVERLCLENYLQEPDEKEGPADYWKRFNNRANISPCQTTESGVVGPAVLEDERGGGSGEAGDDSN